ncbi:PAAR-like domain-containing protein [Polyangium sp. y55x31]|uniref:PAAR-like domain-containing protein n=1 Tax=Polyangium sp. y55x31 TaxID=3042688 RepID=UPI0024827296|nr:PAAR-like domain-containing protein [Polyangium sp. y55x31]MDI1480997.1 DUF4150 domain-containing protein [Polyangium sp. y55x31]
MGATVTNEDRGVTTKTSDHTAMTIGPTDVCFDPPKQKPVPHINHVTTDKAVEHTSGKTLFQNGNVVRVGEAITPSDPAHGDSGGGVVSGTYREEARATAGSPDVRAEGKPPARTDDPTTQNHSNTTGKILQDVPPELLTDNPEEFFKRCSYDTSEIKGGDEEAPFVGNMPQIDIKRGDEIKIVAKRKNAKVPDAPPDCVQPPHMKWLLTRSGGLTALGAAIPDKTGEMDGDEITLGEDWNPKYGGPIEFSGEASQNDSDATKRRRINDKNNYARQNAAARGSSRVENQDGRRAYQQIQYDKRLEESALNNLRTLAEFLWAWRAYQNPVRILITGRACSGGVSYEVHCYPEGEFTFELPLEPIIRVGRWINRSLETVQQFARLGRVETEGSIKAPGDDFKVEIQFKWEPGEDADLYRMVRTTEVSVSGLLFELKFEGSCPLTNFLAIVPFVGGVAASAVGWIIQRMGAEASIGFGVEVSISAAAYISFKWTKARGWQWDTAGVKLPVEVKIYAFIRVQVRDWLQIEGRIQVESKWELLLEASDAGLALKSGDGELKAGLTGLIKIDVWFYSYEQTGAWWPDCLKTEFKKTDLATLISN